MHTLEVAVKPYGTDVEISGNIRSCIVRGLPELTPAICNHDGTFVVVGSGPSLVDSLESIRNERRLGRPICAIKGAHDYLVENGITPDLFVSVEPRDRTEQLTRRSNDTVYLLASRCHPNMFEHLRDYKVLVWHAHGSESEQAQFSGRFSIGGGTTSGLRAVNIAYVMGYRKVSMYGMDSCLSDDGNKHWNGGRASDVVDVIVGGRIFYCSPALAQQANEFQDIFKVMGDIHIDVAGDGLLARIMATRRLKASDHKAYNEMLCKQRWLIPRKKGAAA